MTKATLKVSTFHPFHLYGKDRNGQTVEILKINNGNYLAVRGDGGKKKFKGDTPFIEVLNFLS